MKSITIGQYYAVDSPIHRLDPRVKLFATLVFIVALFLAQTPAAFGLAIVFLAFYVHISKVPLRYILRGLKPVLFLLIISVLFNLLLTKGEVVFSIWKIQITREGIIFSAFMAVRLIMLIIGASMMTYTTTPNQLTDGLEKSFGFLSKIHVPVHEIAMMMSIALRFIPILTEETDKIMKAQMARGADFESGRLIRRVMNMIPLLVPLFISAIRRAGDLSLAMEARCYHGGEGRTKMRPLRYKAADYIAYAVILLFLAGMILLKVFHI
ncbi:MAG: energy-coupling factor transporter transmembrane protein EcfT [Lachnospiraceae bacterium]|nr:energy-coupling factor transporter transmembrane protein EcfT [Lachnospiraceae bacterium]